MLPPGARLRALVALSLLAGACGAPPTGPGPVPQGPTISSIAPNSGPTSGGTAVTIRGSGFAAGTTITIGGRPATDVSVTGADIVTAKTPDSSVAGAVDVVVTVSGRTAAMMAGFRYEPVGPNTAPVVSAIVAQGKRAKQPASFADYGETIQITLVVADAELPASQLVYEWRACGGVFIGTGPQVEWTAPAIGSLPSACTIDVTVIDGPHVQTRSLVVRLHNSIEELRSLAVEFLLDFVNNDMPPATVVRNFSESSGCGKASELKDVTGIRTDLIHDTHEYGETAVSVAFGTVCRFTKSVGMSDACIVTPVVWRATLKLDSTKTTTTGSAFLTGIYETNRWRLCESRFDGTKTPSLSHLSFFR
jgi:hypothetical protein